MWLVRNSSLTEHDGARVEVVGVSDFVRDQEAVFFTALDEIELVDPRQTKLVADDSPNFRHSHLFLEAVLRRTALPQSERGLALADSFALVAAWLGITADQLIAIYRSRYHILAQRDSEMYFDANGRKIAASHHSYGHGQTKDDYLDLLQHLASPATTPPPEGYTAPFYKADRETEMRAAHAHSQARLDAEIDAGRWTPLTPDEDGS
ncbi:hypothetical protein ABZX88_03595 [Kitasatospora aureofaciens]